MTLDALKKAGVPVLAYGNFVTVAVNFLILAFVIFLMVQADQPAAQRHAPPKPRPPSRRRRRRTCVLLREIRDALRR